MKPMKKAALALLASSVLLMLFYLLHTSRAAIPAWVLRTGFSEWFLRTWPALVACIIAIAFVPGVLLFAHFSGWLKTPQYPPPAPKEYPHRPDLSTRELWDQEDRGQIRFR